MLWVQFNVSDRPHSAAAGHGPCLNSIAAAIRRGASSGTLDRGLGYWNIETEVTFDDLRAALGMDQSRP